VFVLIFAVVSTAEAQRGGGGGRGGGAGEGAAADATPEQLQQFDTGVLVTLVDNVAGAVEPAPDMEVAIEWVSNDSLRAGPGLTYVPFSVSIDDTALQTPDVALYVRAVEKNAPPTPDGELPTYDWDAIGFPTLDADGRLTRFMTLEPGEYDVFVAVKRRSVDAASAEAPPFGLLRYDLSVPDYDSEQLSTSSFIRFTVFDQLPGQPTDEQLEENPYIFGTNRFVRLLSTDYSQAGQIGFLFFIYGADTDDAGMPDMGVEFTFNEVTADGTELFTRMDPIEFTSENFPPEYPMETGIFVANGAPLGSFTPGDYLLQVMVTDRAADETVVHDVNFTVR
jgi:hypothetical protein